MPMVQAQAGSELSWVPTFFLFPRESGWRRVRANLSACIAAPPQTLPKRAWAYAPMFRSAHLRKGYPLRSVAVSALLHVGAVAGLISFPGFPAGAPRLAASLQTEPPTERQIIWYRKADVLPPISPPAEKPKVERNIRPRSLSVPVRPAFQPLQTLASKPPAPDNRRQTIVQPESAPLQIRTEIRVPNLVAWTPQLIPPPPSESAVRRTLAEIRVPTLPTPAVPVVRPVPAPPKLEGLRAVGSEVPAAPVPRVEVPKLPVPVRIASVPPPPPPPPQQKIPAETPTPLAPAITPETTPAVLPNLVAVSIVPAPPQEEIIVPAGSRAGEFLAAPEGTGNESGPVAAQQGGPTDVSGESSLTELAGNELAEIRLPGLSVSSAVPTDGAALGVEDKRPPAPAADDLRKLLARATRPSLAPELPRGQPMDSEFFGNRRVYTVYLNMPNLTSGSGSWVLRFAEPEGEGKPEREADALSAPEAIRKVDPMYVPSAVREKIQGTVTLVALVLRDGTVANIRVVRGLDPRLDSSAVAALTQWQFHPATRNGVPVDLEVLVQIPFRLHTF